jgi:predicted transcriptional regulator
MKNMKSQILGSLEQDIMNVLWEKDSLRSSEIKKILGDKYAYTTIVTSLNRLSDKELIQKLKDGKTTIYNVNVSKKAFVNSRVKRLFKSLVDNYGELAISQFVDTLKEESQDIELLEEYLEKKKQK